MTFDRITVEPDKLQGKPCLRGLRISVESVVRLVAAGWTFDEILADYPDLEREDIQQALEYAATGPRGSHPAPGTAAVRQSRSAVGEFGSGCC